MSKVLALLGNRASIARLCVELGLILALAYVCSQAFWMVFAPSKFSGEASIPPVAGGPVYAETAGHNDTFSILTTTNPFLPADRAGTSVSEAALNAPETSLNLSLKGVRANGDGGGVAYISLPDNTQKVVSVGAEILDGVEVKYVFADRVTLLTRGELETLYRRDPNAETGISRRAGENAAVVGSAQIADNAGAGELVQTKSVLAPLFLSSVNFTVVRENGERAGYRLTPKTDPAILTSAGFEPGDIIRSVNSSPVFEIDTEELQELLIRSGVVDFYVERAGETVPVSVRFLEGDRR